MISFSAGFALSKIILFGAGIIGGFCFAYSLPNFSTISFSARFAAKLNSFHVLGAP